MAEFYVIYLWRDARHVGIVSAPAMPATLQFASYNDLQAAMDAMGNEWELRAEIQDPREFESAPEVTDAWLKQLAKARELMQEPKSPRDLLAQGIPPVI